MKELHLKKYRVSFSVHGNVRVLPPRRFEPVPCHTSVLISPGPGGYSPGADCKPQRASVRDLARTLASWYSHGAGSGGRFAAVASRQAESGLPTVPG